MKLSTSVCGGALAVALAVTGALPAAAGDGHDGHGDPSGTGDRVTVIASGLANPRGLAVDGGTLYIAQAGAGGPGPCVEAGEEGGCLGATGKISSLRLRKDGASVRDLVTGLPSLAADESGDSAGGPSDVAVDDDGRVWASIGLGGLPSAVRGGLGDTDLANQLGTVGRVRGGQYVVRGDVAAYEEAANPDGVVDPETGVPAPDSNPNSLTFGRRGSVLVADAGGNTLVKVSRSGDVEAVAVFPTKPAAPVSPAPDAPLVEAQAVPDSVTRGPDGTYYIGELTGFPFTPGAAAVWSWRPGQEPEVFASGFTNIIDLAVTRSGDLLVLEIAADGLLAGPPVGALYRVPADGGERVLVDTGPLSAPGGIAVDRKYAYISNNSISGSAGEIVRVRLD